jgi:lactoylglutathione lyase
MKLHLTHFRLLVANYKYSFLFYRDLLGFDVIWGDENTGYAEFNTGLIQLAIFKRELMNTVVPNIQETSSIANQDQLSLIFAVDDVDQIAQKLQENNVVIVTQPLDRPDWGIRTAHFRDPDGNLLEIYTNIHQEN